MQGQLMAPPSLLLFYHVPKTGGSTMREWLLRNAGIRASGLPKRLDGYVRYYEAHCFMCLQFGSLFADTATCRKHVKECSKQYGSSKPAVKAGGVNPLRIEWQSAGRLAVEFHGITEKHFVLEVLPRLAQLRRLYVKRGGTCSALTLSRDPIDLYFSNYHMWPPRLREGLVIPFPQYLASVRGLLTSSFVQPDCWAAGKGHLEASATRRRRELRCGCDASRAELARANLKRFDFVGLTSCLNPSVFLAAEALLRLPPERTVTHALRRMSRHGNVSLGFIRSKPTCTDCTATTTGQHRVWTWHTLNASTQADVRTAAAACDDAVHAEAMELAATQLANVVNATSCVHEERHKYLRARGNTSRNSARV